MDNKDTIISIKNVYIKFNLASERIDNFKEYLIKTIKRQVSYDEFWALKDISFDVKRGDSVGLIGVNGSGKSTILKIIAGVLKPTKGSVYVGGSVAPLIELGAGFDIDLTARENVFLNGALLGHTRPEMEGFYDEIVEFSELHDFMDVPVKNFSSGMVARLGFSIATIGHPDILICDEILAVGDAKFQEKCMVRIHQLMNEGTTILFVSHSIEQVMDVCNKAVWINKGHLKMMGDSKEVGEIYRDSLKSHETDDSFDVIENDE
ncbi:MAG: ABC transporter ATP-binding protein [Lachnospiraceae bacterium]|jgi:ABC-2 type transport system ATP-binding protein/lipopolysaccharide transport system ATP-binding protein|nr:ABC transporter ATP-binding protein [Lachnospiraceae bacterium]